MLVRVYWSMCVCVHSDREHHCIVIWWWWRWWYECEVKTAEVLFFLRINDCGSLLFHNLVIYKKLFASMNFLHSTYCITSGVWIWLTVVQLLCYLQLFNSHITYSCSTLMLLTVVQLSCYLQLFNSHVTYTNHVVFSGQWWHLKYLAPVQRVHGVWNSELWTKWNPRSGWHVKKISHLWFRRTVQSETTSQSTATGNVHYLKVLYNIPAREASEAEFAVSFRWYCYVFCCTPLLCFWY